jgi:uncharacterized protein YjbJ (UPF0337 family)
MNKQTLEGHWNEIVGKVRQRWGEISNDELETSRGSIQSLVGMIQRKTGESRETIMNFLSDITNNASSMVSRAAESVKDYASTAAGAVAGTAQSAMDAVRDGYQNTTNTVRRHPLESVAICFGAGLLTGIIVAMVCRR